MSVDNEMCIVVVAVITKTFIGVNPFRGGVPNITEYILLLM